MKSNFKYILVVIIAVLCVVFLVQIFWLRGLYVSMKDDAGKNVMQCIDLANARELELRIDRLEKQGLRDSNLKGSISINQSFGGDEVSDSDSASHKVVTHKKMVNKGDTLHDRKEVEDKDRSFYKFDQMSAMIKELVHQMLDEIEPVDLDVFVTSLANSLVQKGIRAKPCRVAILALENDSLLNDTTLIGGVTSFSEFTYIYSNEPQLGYHVQLESLTETVLAQMFGILTTTLLIVLILAFAFWFLIRTIFRQKTIEEMKDDFTNNMTHELKTPIAVAYSATDVLLNFGQAADKERREKYLTICKDQLEKLGGLVEQILSISMERRMSFVLNKEHVMLKPLLDTLVEQHRLKADKEVMFHLKIVPVDIEVYADRFHLANMLSNLIDNAIKYSNARVEVRIDACVKDGFSVITVSDNGIGIAADKQKYLFDKFYRVPQGNVHNAKGYGIGLFYVKTIVEKHGGTVSAKSRLGKGAIFTIKLPLEQ